MTSRNLPGKYGFNMLWMFSKGKNEFPFPVEPAELDFIANEGFNFIRIPMDYRYWTNDFDYTHPREEILERIDRYIMECNSRGLHACLNMHRVPGYCINRPETEKHNLWRDREAQDGFVFLWRMFAERYKGISSARLSFDLVNEPDTILPTHPCTREDHEQVIRRTVEAILTADPERQIVIDGFNGGHNPLPELADLGTEHGVIHSGRGYAPFPLTHHGAEWVRDRDPNAPMPSWPRDTADGVWNIDWLRHFYAGWLELTQHGVPVHIGEFGCYNKVSNSIALPWFEDLLTVFNENQWGYALWNFRGPFGIVEHGRPDTQYEDMSGFKVDRALLELLKSGAKEYGGSLF